MGKESRDLNDHRESAKQRYQRREFQAEGIADARTLGCRINLKDLRSRKKKLHVAILLFEGEMLRDNDGEGGPRLEPKSFVTHRKLL